MYFIIKMAFSGEKAKKVFGLRLVGELGVLFVVQLIIKEQSIGAFSNIASGL